MLKINLKNVELAGRGAGWLLEKPHPCPLLISDVQCRAARLDGING
jgi:hypothetical protein